MTTSLDFLGDASSNIIIPYAPALNFGTGDFTIEWYQYETDTNANPNPFSRGTYSTPTIGVSIEGTTFYYWIGGTTHSFSYSRTPNAWTHFAIVRSGGTTAIYKNGNNQTYFTDTNNYSSSDNLTIANEMSLTNNAAFGGYMAYFSWNVGYARYNTNFTVNNDYPPLIPSTVLLLSAYGSLGTLGGTVISSNVTTIPQVPFVPPYPPPPAAPAQVNTFYNSLLYSLYTDNARVFYKPNSLAWSIGSTVRNSRAVSKRT
jgi:hypothetical protein